jgi:ABC-type dipeptide/oligopeptide/nickel transport system ATPase component
MEEGFSALIKKRLSTKRNFLATVVGDTGSGKSWTALAMAERLDANKDFNESHIVFTAQDFLQCVDKLGNNCFIVVDEAGLMFSHREYATMINRMLSFVLQSFRYKFINCIFTLPNLGYMDYVGRSLMHYVFRMLDRGECRVYRVQKDQLGRKCFFPTVIDKLIIPKPSEEIVKVYEAKKASIMGQRYKDYLSEVEGQQFTMKFASPNEIVRHIHENKLEGGLQYGGKYDVVTIMAAFNVGMSKAYIIKKMLEREKEKT